MAAESTTRRRLVCGVAPVMALLLTAPTGALLLTSRAAQAHAVLEASTPAPNATVAAGRIAFRLQFNSRVDAGRSRLRLVRPDGSETTLAIGAGDANVLTAEAVLAAGAYRLRWQVLAVDGHITHGALAFTVRAP
jgi:methionine-rich copper-binding protein CopC